jgi:formylglycine-generating enzyme required for sulfatase activity
MKKKLAIAMSIFFFVLACQTISPIPTPTATPPPTLTPAPLNGIGSTLVRPADRMTMVYVPTGKFQMGISQEDAIWLVEQDWCSWNEDHCEVSWFNDEQPIHTVDLDAFWIDKYEVTNGQYASCVAEGDCSSPKDVKSYDHELYYGNSEFNNYPVLFMDWTQANSYCAWAGGRLPTEAEWEKAARGTDERIFPWGNDKPNCTLANFGSPCGWDFTEAGSHPLGASPYGAMDMAGNVWEWVSDWYQYDYYEISPLQNPQGPSSGENRIMRGGTVAANELTSRTTQRSAHDPNDGWIINGFRCVMDVE